MCKHTLIQNTVYLILFLLAIAIPTTSIVAQDSLLINYQGRLTDSDSAPVADGDYMVMFTIYDEGGTNLWSSDWQDVSAMSGLINYILGSAVPIPKSVFDYSSLYLGITVDPDPEMSPRTRLTSSPSAAVAYNLAGSNVETSEGILTVKNPDQTEEINIGSTERGGVGVQLRATGADENNLLTIAGQADFGAIMTFYDPASLNGRESMSFMSEPDGLNIVGFNPQPEPPGLVAFEIFTNSAKGSGGMFNIYDLDSVKTSLSGGTLEIGRSDASIQPYGSFAVEGSNCTMKLTSESAAGDNVVISMITRPDSAKVGIGTNTPEEALHVVGNIGLTGEMVILTTTKLKTNIRSIDNAVEIVNNLNGVRYNYRSNEYPELKLPERDQIGLLAEDVEKVLPELVFEDSNSNKSVAYIKLTAVLIEAVKELKSENDELKARIEALENK
jgi:Chaperone of endosialidase